MNDGLIKFIKYSVSQKEISLIITKDEKEIQKVIKTLKEIGYQEKTKGLEIINLVSQPSKIFITLKNDFPKDIYDFIVQYPTGQIEIYDKEKLISETVVPVYREVSIIVVTDEKTIRKSKFQILDKVGLTYRGNL